MWTTSSNLEVTSPPGQTSTARYTCCASGDPYSDLLANTKLLAFKAIICPHVCMVQRSGLIQQSNSLLQHHLVYSLFLLIPCVFDYLNPITNTREELLIIRQFTPHFMSFHLPRKFSGNPSWRRSVCALQMKEACWCTSHHLNCTRQCSSKSPYLANAQSLPNKMDDLPLLNGMNKEFAHSAAHCFIEIWLSESIPHSNCWPSAYTEQIMQQSYQGK